MVFAHFTTSEGKFTARLFDAETGGYFRLSQGTVSQRKMEQSAPLGLAQAHGFEPLIELQTPGTGDAVKEGAK